jgi:hypothetical protein
MDSGTCKMCGRDDIEPLEDLLGAIEGVKNTINKLTIPGSKEDERNRYSSNLHNLIKKYAQVDNMFGDDYKSDYNKLIDAYNTKVYTYEDWEAGVPYPEDLIIDWMDWHSNGMNVNKYDLKYQIQKKYKNTLKIRRGSFSKCTQHFHPVLLEANHFLSGLGRDICVQSTEV